MGRSGTRAGDSDAPRDQPERETRQRRERTSKNKGKEPASSSAQPDAPQEQTRAPTYPWPRPDDEPFTDPAWKVPLVPFLKMKDFEQLPVYRNRMQGGRWGRAYCIFYNGLQRVGLTPTRFICPHTLRKMGIEEDVRQMLQRMGLGTLPYKTYPLYPELVRQFLASAELLFEDVAYPVADQGTLSFFSSGKLYKISIHDLCRLYGFDTRPQSCRFTDNFERVTELWNFIGPGRYESRSAKLTLIRNPVIRVVAKVLGSTLFAKDESGSLRRDELLMIHLGLPRFIDDIYSAPPPPMLSTNLGAIFAEILVQKKTRGLNTNNQKFERIGSLLTPIFMHCGIDLTSTLHEQQILLYDEKFFRNTGILRGDYMYQFTDREEVVRRCQLPIPDYAYLATPESIAFTIAPELVQQAPIRQRGGSSRAPASQPHMEDERVPHYQPPRGSQWTEDSEFILPPYTGEFDLPPLPAEATAVEKCLYESHRRTHSMFERMWGALARMRCPRPPSCFGETGRHQEADTARAETSRAQDAPIPDVAGHGTTDVEDEADRTDSDSRLPRRRRQLGQHDSGSSNDH